MKLDVSPYITADGDIASLIGLADPTKIKQSDNAPTKISDSADLEFTSSKTTIDIVASMGFGSMVDVNATSEAVFFMIDLKLPNQKVPGAPGSFVEFEYYGIAVRICVKAWKISADASVDLGMVASNASASTASVAYQVDVIGINTYEIKSLPGLIAGSIGPFDVSKLQTVGAVFSDLTQYIAKYPDKCRPELLAVEIDLKNFTVPYQKSSSETFGLGRIEAGFSYQDAILQKPPTSTEYPDVKDDLVAAVYDAIVTKLDKPPNQTQSEKAKGMLDAGTRDT